MAWRQSKVEELREYLVKSYISKVATMAELCDECSVSRKTGYKWYQRYLEGGTKALNDISRAPKEPFQKFSKEEIQIALDLKQKHPRYGPKKILALLERKHPHQEWPSATRLYEVFKDNHLVCSRKLRRRVPRSHPLGEINCSNDVWCADFKGWFLTSDRSKVEPLTITDGYSRFLIRCQHLERKTFEAVWGVYSQAFKQYGLPLRMRTDNGPPFATTGIGRLSRLAVNLVKAGVTPEWTTPGHPEENGQHERFHRSLKDSVANPPAGTFPEQIQRIEAFIDEYNFERPHEALSQGTPGSCYEPSPRQWDGTLKSPEYDTTEVRLRKVGSSGAIFWKQMCCYVGTVIRDEYVSLKEVDNGHFHVNFGPIYLGTLIEGQGLIQPKLERR